MIKKICALAIICALFLSGCQSSDYTEPEDRTVVTMLIISQKSGYLLTAETYNGDNESNSVKMVSSLDKSLEEAFNMLEKEVYNELSFYHCPIIVCEAELFKNNKEEIIKFLLNIGQISLSADILISSNIDNITEFAKLSGNSIGYEISDYISYNGIESEIIDILTKSVDPAKIKILSNEEFIVSED